MPVTLLPPITNSLGDWCGRIPLTTAPRYARGPGNSRWHRIRSAVQYPVRGDRDGYVIYHWWCGQSAGSGNGLWLVDELPAEEPACGTCVGRALGAKQDDIPGGLPPLRFDPRWLERPSLCPGSGSDRLLIELPGGTCAQCLACGDIHRTRASGGPYNPRWGLAKHPPGAGLCEPCPFHAWNRIVESAGAAVCGCGWPGEAS